MILLDEHLNLVHDEDTAPSKAMRESLIRYNPRYSYAREDLLYHIGERGELSIVYLSKPKFHSVHLGYWDLEAFRRDRRVALDDLVIRDTGCQESRVYLDDFSFTVPTELLLR